MPTAAEAASFGLTVAEASGEPLGVWPDNWTAVNVFIAMSTQWRSGGMGATGLDYNALPAVMRLSGVKPGERPDVFESIRILEDAALESMRKKP